MPRSRLLLSVLFLLLFPLSVLADEAKVEFFSPTGLAKGVRQVTARFNVPMVPFGDPRLVEPFDVNCTEPGKARWADSRNWVYDFDRDLPGGVSCIFRLKSDVKSLDGETLTGTGEFSFNTGGPNIREMLPYEGSTIDEEQVFIIGLDAPVDAASVSQQAWCDIEGVEEKVGVRLLGEKERRELFEHKRNLFDRMIRAVVIRKDDGAVVGALDTRDVLKGSELERMVTQPEESPIVVLACQRRLPNGAKVRLVWGSGIRTVSGLAVQTDQPLAFQVRDEFRAEFHCNRVNRDAPCVPILPMSLNFSAPIARKLAGKIELKAANGTRYRPTLGGDPTDEFVSGLSFLGPFPERASFNITLPADLRDDARRPLANGAMFPLKVATDEYPPLAKFPALFGIIERNADATLPVTVRNIEAQLNFHLKRVAGFDKDLMSKAKNAWNALFTRDQGESIGARIMKVENGDILEWYRRVHERSDSEGKESLFRGEQTETLSVPKAQGAAAFEVVGIPLKKPGFYVVELASPRLGAALLHDPQDTESPPGPYYIRTAALVTNLSVHFKHGRESSLVWVTSLDKGLPVAEADVEVRDCGGGVHFQGKTDANGLLRVGKPLPRLDELPGCVRSWDRQYFVTARTSDDYSFVFSNWNEGISPWRFHLPEGSHWGAYAGTTVFARTLLRAGDTVYMTHFYRKKVGSGFAFVDKARLPDKLVIQHMGSDQTYEQRIAWDDKNVAESRWTIPKDAQFGTYEVRFTHSKSTGNERLPEMTGGSFRVEAFRVPTVKAVLKPLDTPVVNAGKAVFDAQLNYLSGGGVGGASVKFRGIVQPHTPTFSDYEGFVIANGNVREGLDNDERQSWYSGDYELEGEGDGEGYDGEGEGGETSTGTRILSTRSLSLDNAGAARVTFDNLPKAETPQILRAEMEYADANGEILTSSARVPLWPAKIVVGLKPDAWAASKEKVRFHAVALGLDGKPKAGVAIKLDMLKRTHYSHRKRLIGGFYAYQSHSEVKRVKDACEGRTDAKGLLICEFSSPVDGNLIVRAKGVDEAGNAAYANHDIWVAGKEDWWFDVSNDDRMDLLPEKRSYQPDETAVFQVRMPFREATALVTVEREGVSEAFVTKLSGKAPVVRVPLKGHYAPNVFVSVLALRGRVAGVQPTALIDLGKPAFKLGIAQIKVGWKAHELKVDVVPDRQVYGVRNKSTVKVKVSNPDGTPARGGEVAFAAVDEGVLELMPNNTWNLLEAMMAERGINVTTSTAQMQVVGRRHYGRKAVAAGGGGGSGGDHSSRQLFDTLLLWQGRVRLDQNGEATVQVPINDSLTSFRLVAVAHSGASRFGTGRATIRTTQDLMVLSGLPQQVREQDRYAAGITVRNTSAKPLNVTVNAGWRATETEGGAPVTPVALTPKKITLPPGQAQSLSWEATAPINARRIEWKFSAEAAAAKDQIKIVQKVIPAVAVRTFQATLTQIEQPLSLPVAIPADAIPGRGGIKLHLRARLADELSGVKQYMAEYPYTCLEQQASQAIALDDEARWEGVMNALPAYLDSDGLAKYFPTMREGSETLTAYLMIVADEAGWSIPERPRQRMQEGLRRFVQGHVVRYSALPTADLTLRKLSALNAVARYEEEGINPDLISSITVDPNLWPTSGVLDWLDIVKRSPKLGDAGKRRREAEQIIRTRLNFQGTTMGFSTERSDALWWLMCSADSNANRALISLMDSKEWQEDLPRLVRGSLGRQHKGSWNTTVANAWGVLAMTKFSEKFERTSVSGSTEGVVGSAGKKHDWSAAPRGGTLDLGWPAKAETLRVTHEGAGKPWLTLQSLAAIPLKEPFSSGYKIARTVSPVDQKVAGVWSRGDVYRVRLDLEAQADMTWVVVRDPIPSGATILGSGLGGDSQILTRGEKRQGWVWPAFEERTQESFRAYYEFVPKGKWTVEYTVRLNNPGQFALPETRVEALYSPEAFAEIPNKAMEVRP